MKIYSFENANSTTTETDNDVDNVLYDMFERKMVNNRISDTYYIIPIEKSCRIDLISKELYGSVSYTEEIMVMSNIVNPFSVKTNDMILYASDYTKLDLMYVKESTINQGNKFKILNINKSKSSNNQLSLPPSVNPGMKQINVDYNKKKITIINKFK